MIKKIKKVFKILHYKKRIKKLYYFKSNINLEYIGV